MFWREAPEVIADSEYPVNKEGPFTDFSPRPFSVMEALLPIFAQG
jgi:hypothetical protein